VKVVVAAKFCEGANVKDRPSFDNVTLPVMLVVPWDNVSVPGTMADA